MYVTGNADSQMSILLYALIDANQYDPIVPWS